MIADDDDAEDFVNISITPVDPNERTTYKEKTLAAQVDDKGLGQSSPKKAFSILSSSTGLFHRKRLKTELPGKSPRQSPDMKPKNQEHMPKKEEEEKPAVKAILSPVGGFAKKRSKSDVTSLTKERQVGTVLYS